MNKNDQKETTRNNSKGSKAYCLLFWGLLVCILSFGVTTSPLVNVYVDDPNPTPESLKFYRTSITGEPRFGIDYSANPVFASDPRLHFRDIPLRIGIFEKRIHYLENGERIEIFTPSGREGLSPDEYKALKKR